MKRRLIGVLSGILVASAPALAAAQEELGSRATDAPEDATAVMLVTVAALLGLFLVSALGFLYRRKRNLDWEFQKPDPSQQAHHHEEF